MRIQDSSAYHADGQPKQQPTDPGDDLQVQTNADSIPAQTPGAAEQHMQSEVVSSRHAW